MLSNRFAFAALAAGCLAAAGLGGYFASRQTVTPATVAAAPAHESSSAQPVQETEATVGGAKAAARPETPAPVSGGARRSEAASVRPQPVKAAKPAATGAVAQNNQPPALDHTWPTSATVAVPEAAPPVPNPDTSVRQDAPHQAEIPLPAEPAAKAFEELVIATNSVVGLQMESAVTSERARIEDRVEARVVRDVKVGGEVAIPAGTRAIGSVMVVERGGKFKERARLGIRFHTLVLADGMQLPIATETIYRYSEPPSNGSAAKVGGGAVAGAILGAIIGGSKGAAIGGVAGAGAGTAVVMAGDASTAAFPAGSDVTARFIAPVTVTVEK